MDIFKIIDFWSLATSLVIVLHKRCRHMTAAHHSNVLLEFKLGRSVLLSVTVLTLTAQFIELSANMLI